MTAPGYARPNTAAPIAFDRFDIGKRHGSGQGSVINTRPVGSYLEAAVGWDWGIEAARFSFTLPVDHPITNIITPANVQRTAWHLFADYNGIPFTGRFMEAKLAGPPGREVAYYSGVDYKHWLTRMYAWVNNLFPPEVQINLTGKQDMRWGIPDSVFKRYLASVATRLNVPVHAALPIKQPEGWNQANLADINSLDDLLDLIFEAGDGVIGLQARFPPLSDLFEPTVERLELGVSVDLWDGLGDSPEVFNTSSLAALQSIINYSSDNFLDLSQLLKPVNNGLWQWHMDRAGYVFDTHLKRDRRNVQFRTDGGQIVDYENAGIHADGYMAIVGGKSPSIVNSIIEMGANLAIAALIAVIATIPGASGVAGLSVGVGDLFDDIFFAYQVFWDDDIRDEVGPDDAFCEDFADNTSTWSIDGYATAHRKLNELGGNQQLTIHAQPGTADGRGISFGADNDTPRRYKTGDIVTFWDRGNTVEQYVSSVIVNDKPGEYTREVPTVGKDKRAKGPWDRLFGAVDETSAAFRGYANAV